MAGALLGLLRAAAAPAHGDPRRDPSPAALPPQHCSPRARHPARSLRGPSLPPSLAPLCSFPAPNLLLYFTATSPALTLWGHLDVKLQFFSLFPFSPPAFGVVSLGRCAKPRSWRILQGKPDLVTNPSPPCTARGVLPGDVLLTRIPRGRTKGLSALSQRSRSHFSCEKRKKKKTLGFLFQADRIHFRSRSLVCSTPADSWWKQRDRRGGIKLFFLALFIFF